MNIELHLIDIRLYIKNLEERLNKLEKDIRNEESKENIIRRENILRKSKQEENEDPELLSNIGELFHNFPM
jgi:hypothetical protein